LAMLAAMRRLVACHQVSRRASSRLLLEIDMGRKYECGSPRWCDEPLYCNEDSFLLYGKYIVVDMVAAFERNHFTDCLDGVEPTVFLRFCLECRGSYEVAIARL
jgi:hypothetical protein